MSPGREHKYSTTLLNHVIILNLWYSISQRIFDCIRMYLVFFCHIMTSKLSHGLANITTNPVAEYILCSQWDPMLLPLLKKNGLAVCLAGHLSKDTSGYQEEECQHAVSCCQDCCFAVFWLLFSYIRQLNDSYCTYRNKLASSQGCPCSADKQVFHWRPGLELWMPTDFQLHSQ